MNAQAMIAGALREGNQLRLHQNGFIQLDLLDGKSRLHIWDKEIPPAQNPRSPVHNHRFCFSSYILCGELINQHYTWHSTEEMYSLPIKDNDPYCELYTGSGDYQNLVPLGIAGTVREGRGVSYTAGERYFFPHGAYHDNFFHGLTATIMTKEHENCIPLASVVVEPGTGAPDNAFRRDKYSQQELIPFVEQVLERLRR